MADRLALLGGAKAVTRGEELDAIARWPVYGDEEKAAVLEAMDDPALYTATTRLEEEFAAYHGARHALAHCNGTSSIHAALFAVGVGPGDEVIVPAYTWHLGASQALALHALPVFCDIDPDSGAIRPDEIARKLSARTRAILVVHPFGVVAPMDEIMAIARERGVPVIEDASHAHGATYRGRKTGMLSDIGCFSLQAAKLINAIEGGVLITDNRDYFERATMLAHYERIPALQTEEYRKFNRLEGDQAPSCFGHKYRMHPLGAAIARVQLRHMDEWNAVRRRNLNYLTRRIGEVGGGVLTPAYSSPEMDRIWLNYLCQYHGEGVPRERFIEALCAEGLPATGGRAGYLPLYWNPLYEERVSMWGPGYPFDAPAVREPVRYERGMCPVAEALWKRTIGLPVLHREASVELLEEIVTAVARVVAGIDDLR